MQADLRFLNTCRIVKGPYGSSDDDKDRGAFLFRHNGYEILVISSGTDNPSEWEHVSVSKRQGKKPRMPTWEDMEIVKTLFWGVDETVVQFHPKGSEKINMFDALHLWKRRGQEWELPPSILVGMPMPVKQENDHLADVVKLA